MWETQVGNGLADQPPFPGQHLCLLLYRLKKEKRQKNVHTGLPSLGPRLPAFSMPTPIQVSFSSFSAASLPLLSQEVIILSRFCFEMALSLWGLLFSRTGFLFLFCFVFRESVFTFNPISECGVEFYSCWFLILQDKMKIYAKCMRKWGNGRV